MSTIENKKIDITFPEVRVGKNGHVSVDVAPLWVKLGGYEEGVGILTTLVAVKHGEMSGVPERPELIIDDALSSLIDRNCITGAEVAAICGALDYARELGNERRLRQLQGSSPKQLMVERG